MIQLYHTIYFTPPHAIKYTSYYTNETKLYLTNNIFFLQLTSKYWNSLIDNYIDHNYKNKQIYFNCKTDYASMNGHIDVLEWFKKWI